MLSKKRTILVLFFIVVFLFCLFPIQSQALSWDEISEKAQGFVQKGEAQDIVDDENLYDLLGPVGQILIVIATIVLVVCTLVMGIKWMMASSDPETQAKLKKQLIGLAISTGVIIGAQAIWALVYKVLNDAL